MISDSCKLELSYDLLLIEFSKTLYYIYIYYIILYYIIFTILLNTKHDNSFLCSDRLSCSKIRFIIVIIILILVIFFLSLSIYLTIVIVIL